VHQHAVVDADELPGLPVHETQSAFRPNSEPGMVAVAILVRGRHHRQHRHVGETAHPLQGVGHNVTLDGQLMFIVNMLPLTAGTVPVVRARRLDSGRSGFQHANHPGCRVPPVYPDNLGHHPLPRNASENEYVVPLAVAHGFAQAAPRDQGQDQLLAFDNNLLVQTFTYQTI